MWSSGKSPSSSKSVSHCPSETPQTTTIWCPGLLPQTTPTRSTLRSVKGQSVWGSLRPHVPRGSSPGPSTEQPDHLTRPPPTKQPKKKLYHMAINKRLWGLYFTYLPISASVLCIRAVPWCNALVPALLRGAPTPSPAHPSGVGP